MRMTCSVVSWMVSPHTRGSTRPSLGLAGGDQGFPAHAGIDPSASFPRAAFSRFPRTRGDRPYVSIDDIDGLVVSPHTRGSTVFRLEEPFAVSGFPAHAGIDRSCANASSLRKRFPRTRGDRPELRHLPRKVLQVSPHTRGSTRRKPRGARGLQGFPAHAGIDPSPRRVSTVSCRFPRTRGDRPDRPVSDSALDLVSPHTRGSTRLCVVL